MSHLEIRNEFTSSLKDVGLMREYSSPNGKSIIEEIYLTSLSRLGFEEKLEVPLIDLWKFLGSSWDEETRLISHKQSASKQDIREFEMAYELYKQDKLSLGKAAELVGLYYDEMLDEIKKRGLELFFGPRTLAEAKKGEEVIEKYMKKRKEG